VSRNIEEVLLETMKQWIDMRTISAPLQKESSLTPAKLLLVHAGGSAHTTDDEKWTVGRLLF